MSKNADIVVGYNKNDFLYALVNDMPTVEKCNNVYENIDDNACIPFPGNVDVSRLNPNELNQYRLWQDNSGNCLKKELCKNRDYSKKIYKLQNDHLGSDVKYEDTKKLYKNEYMKTINLSIGIIGILAVLFYTK